MLEFYCIEIFFSIPLKFIMKNISILGNLSFYNRASKLKASKYLTVTGVEKVNLKHFQTYILNFSVATLMIILDCIFK